MLPNSYSQQPLRAPRLHGNVNPDPAPSVGRPRSLSRDSEIQSKGWPRSRERTNPAKVRGALNIGVPAATLHSRGLLLPLGRREEAQVGLLSRLPGSLCVLKRSGRSSLLAARTKRAPWPRSMPAALPLQYEDVRRATVSSLLPVCRQGPSFSPSLASSFPDG